MDRRDGSAQPATAVTTIITPIARLAVCLFQISSPSSVQLMMAGRIFGNALIPKAATLALGATPRGLSSEKRNDDRSTKSAPLIDDQPANQTQSIIQSDFPTSIDTRERSRRRSRVHLAILLHQCTEQHVLLNYHVSNQTRVTASSSYSYFLIVHSQVHLRALIILRAHSAVIKPRVLVQFVWTQRGSLHVVINLFSLRSRIYNSASASSFSVTQVSFK